MSARRWINFLFLFLFLFLFSVLSFSGFETDLRAADPFAENIRTTPRLSPADEQRTFRLPPGFEIHLFAAEPDIQKPMNMAFDGQGRLWITDTREYPFPVPPGQKGRDTIKILEDTDGDGRADKVTTFTTGLSIPIGVYPHPHQVVAWSIPNIWSFASGDLLHADEQEKLYGPFGWERDTHGMNSSFTRGFDGWLYATHGFNNNTDVRGRDGHEVKMNSGNIYRFRLDGSRIEQFTWGQVNPFGLCFDPSGNLYSADCHSEPVYQLLRGAYYPSFGKPHDGLGFGPRMIFHDHGSTAISGIVFYSDNQWPEEYWNNVFTGNVMTSKIDRDAITFQGTTPTANERPAFLSTDDPWFRPVNLQYGPDGAIYVADFYNRIIGHYEVPLTHPGRDRTSGRIWRIVYRGRAAPDAAVHRRFNVGQAPTEELIGDLANANIIRRMLAMNELTDRLGQSSVPALKQALAGQLTTLQRVHCLWALFRLGRLDMPLLEAAAGNPEALVRTHAMRILSELADWPRRAEEMALAGLHDSDPLVARCAADALGQHPSQANIRPLLELRQHAPAADTHLIHVARMALRNQFLAPEAFDQLPENLPDRDMRDIADVSVGVPSAAAGAFLLKEVQKVNEPAEKLSEYLRHAARYAPENAAEEIASFSQKQFKDDLEFQMNLFESLQKGSAQAGASLPPKAREWGSTLAAELLSSSHTRSSAWTPVPLGNKAPVTIPWAWEPRNCADGRKGVRFLSSFPHGEQLTGILRSRTFSIPAQLSFYLAGQSGFPNTTQPMRNFMRLRESSSDKLIAETPVPRNDTAQKYTWDLEAWQGKTGYIEVVDGDDGPAYAWIAVARLNPPVVPLPKFDPSAVQKREQSALQLIRSLRLAALSSDVGKLLGTPGVDPETRAAAGLTLATIDPGTVSSKVAPLLADPQEPMTFREELATGLADMNIPAAQTAILSLFQYAPWRLQVKWAASLGSSPDGADRLLEAVRQKQISPHLLLERTVRDRLAGASPKASGVIQELTRNLPPIDVKRQQMIDERRKQVNLPQASIERGAAVFTKNCAVCHQIEGRGAVIGPQLDGIGNRGLERIMEDVLDPNRNVDRAFRTHLIVLQDGDVVSGLPRREEGEVLVLADSTGKEISIPKKQIKERRETESSLMPDNFGDVLPPPELNDLLAFLLSHRGK